MEPVYERLSDSSSMTKKRKKRTTQRIFRVASCEDENNPKTKDILNNKTSKESDKMLVTVQGLGMSESTIKRKRRQLRTDGYLSRKEGSGRNKLTDKKKSKLILDLAKKKCFLKYFKDSQKAYWEL